jgi:uracil-DNA glycosylase
MPENVSEELIFLTGQLRHWLAYQQQLGLQWLDDGKPAPPPEMHRVASPTTPPEFATALTLPDLQAAMGDCRLCKLARSRNRLVWGGGNPQAKLLLIGEAPGEEEDLQGEPFVGPAGQLLNRLLGKLGLNRQDIYITNMVKCRPPGNRNPEAEEIKSCLPFLLKQIQIINPGIICTLGAVASHTLLHTKEPISSLRGQWQEGPQGIRLMPTFHPSYLLRYPKERKKTWDDMQKVMTVYSE